MLFRSAVRREPPAVCMLLADFIILALALKGAETDSRGGGLIGWLGAAISRVITT